MIREASIDDAAAVAALLAVIQPEFLITSEGLRHWMTTCTPEQRRGWWCAEEGDELVGWGTCGIDIETTTPGVVWIGALVRPDRRRRGIGTALWQAAEEHARSVGGRRVLSRSRGDHGSVRFAESRGLARTSKEDMLVIDPRGVERTDPPPGVRLAPFTDFAGDPSPVYAVDAETVVDMPNPEPVQSVSYEVWLQQYWDTPLLDLEASMVAVADGRPAAYTRLLTDRPSGRGLNGGTGTVRQLRGRGLATIAKRASLARAAELGITAVYTGNDSTNAPMLSINRRLGYRHASTFFMWEADLPATSAA